MASLSKRLFTRGTHQSDCKIKTNLIVPGSYAKRDIDCALECAKAPSADTERAINIPFSAGAGHHKTYLDLAVALMRFTLHFN